MDERKPIINREAIINNESSISSENDQSEHNQSKQLSPPTYEKDERWVQEYREQFGTEPSFF